MANLSFRISEEERLTILLDKCEAMSVLCQKTTLHWSFIKFAFQIPLILTSSVMCILNSFDDDKGNMKIPNVVVNGTSVLILALQNNLKVPEKVELFKSLSNNFLQLAHQIEGLELEEISKNNINTFIEKYDSFVIQCQFEDIPKNIKLEVIDLWEDRSIPLQLNGASGLKKKNRDNSLSNKFKNSKKNDDLNYNESKLEKNSTILELDNTIIQIDKTKSDLGHLTY
tara:strand:+ start:3647 stop:4327 length:681 start_codon:yes stop_codon:yes gene_type:complete